MTPPSLRIRPILKRTWSHATTQGDTTAQTLPFAACKDVVVLSPHVHFPPTPIMSSTHAAHSPATYDRRPIVSTPTDGVFPESPSSPAEPEHRGRMGREDDPIKGSYFHPRAYEACEPEGIEDTSSLEPPPLMRDSPSSSTCYDDDDDEDDEAITPPDPKLPASLIIPQALRSGSSAFKSAGAHGGDDSPLAFAPPGVKQGVPRIRTDNGPFIILRNHMSPNEGEGCLGGF